MAKQKSLEQLRAEKEQVEKRLAQEQHKLERLPDCQKADRQDHLYRPCAFQPDRKRNDGGQNQASAP